MNVAILPQKTAAETVLDDAFGASAARASDAPALAKLQRKAFDVFAAKGLPQRRTEAWHYTDLRALMRDVAPMATRPDAAAIEALRAQLTAETSEPRLVLVDGFFCPELSSAMPSGISVRGLKTALAGDDAALMALVAGKGLGSADPIVALNLALMQDGVVIEIAPGAKIEQTLHLIQATATAQPVARFARSLIVVGNGATVQIAESTFGPGGKGQTFGAIVVAVGDGASFGHSAMVADTAQGSARIDTFIVEIGANARFDSVAMIAGAGLVRRQILARFAGDGSRGSFQGISLLRGREHADTTLFVEHVGRACESREVFRHILDGEAVGVFQGKIRVDPLAQKTDGKMMSKALLLSEGASMNNKPELEIFADDVACGHGATCGGLNADQIFYLRTRGIPAFEAEALLLEAFAAEPVEAIADAQVADGFRSAIAAWLAVRSAGVRSEA